MESPSSASPARTPDAGPIIGPEQSLPEITIRSILLGVVLSMVLGAANVYLGLKAGMTVAASIPAAVVSMGLLRMARRSNLLENNIVQTAASAGESLAGGAIFTLPALLILGVWTRFDYWPTTVVCALGGLLGVLFTVPLRRALVVGSELKFPEGVATAEVLKIGHGRGAGAGMLAAGSALGALYKLGESGLKVFTGTVEGAARVGSSVAFFGASTAPALIGVGYIVGLNIAVLVFLGGAINWFVAIPVVSALHGLDDGMAPADAAWAVWKLQTRYIGVGAMVVGGLWALVRMWGKILAGLASGIRAYRAMRAQARAGEGPALLPRTEQDMPPRWLAGGLLLCLVLMFVVFRQVLPAASTTLVVFMAVAMLLASFLFSAVASYMAGLVGSSNNPISGVTIATILLVALLLGAVGVDAVAGPCATILIGAVVCCAAAIGGDNIQDLKTGHIVGATPRKQQIAQVIGTLAGAVVIAPVLTLLLEAYGIGPVGGRPGETALAAPQATLMASVAQGIFQGKLPWTFVYIGAGLAVVVIAGDLLLEQRKAAFRLPVLAVAVGLYLPLELSTALLIGGLVAWAASRGHRRRRDRLPSDADPQASLAFEENALRRGLLLAAGLITGESLLGILLAVPIVLAGGTNPLSLGWPEPKPWLGLGLALAIAAMIYAVSAGRGQRPAPGRP